MKLRERLTRWAHDLRDTPLSELGRPRRALRYLHDLVRHCARELKRDRAGQLAAALTYRTLFSLLPTLALALVVLQVFVGPEDQDRFKSSVLDWVLAPLRADESDPGLLPGAVAPDGSPEGSGRNAAGLAVAATVSPPVPVEEFAEAQHALGERFEQVADELGQIDFRSIGLVGLLLFLYAATGLLRTVEDAFDGIYAARRKRPFHLRLPLYYSVITLGPIVLLAGQYLRGRLLDLLASEALTAWLGRLLAFLSPLLTAWLLLFAMFVMIPNTRVKKRAAAAGAFVSALGVGITAELFRVYVGSAALASLYGALALLPLFLFWLYLVWVVVLFGLEVSYALQTVRGGDWADAEAQAARPVEDAWAVPLVLGIAEAFNQGRLARPDELASALDLPLVAVRKLVDRLEEAGLVHEVDEKGVRAYVLARPAERIAMDDLLEVTQPLPDLSANGALSEALGTFLGEVHRAGLERASGRTLADFLRVESAPTLATTSAPTETDARAQSPDG